MEQSQYLIIEEARNINKRRKEQAAADRAATVSAPVNDVENSSDL